MLKNLESPYFTKIYFLEIYEKNPSTVQSPIQVLTGLNDA